MTRDEAIKIAKEAAYETKEIRSYLPMHPDELEHWVPHEWVIEAILKTADIIGGANAS